MAKEKKENKTREEFKKAWGQIKIVAKDVAKGSGKLRNEYLDEDERRGGGLGLLR
jgi:hypothetical protein